jgi:hypothetical protein
VVTKKSRFLKCTCASKTQLTPWLAIRGLICMMKCVNLYLRVWHGWRAQRTQGIILVWVEYPYVQFKATHVTSSMSTVGVTNGQERKKVLRLSALMDLYIHPLYVLVSKILSSILNSPAAIHPLYHPLSTLSTLGPTCHFILIYPCVI